MAQPAVFADNDRLYGEAGAGLVIFNPPDKDSFPFYEIDFGTFNVGWAGETESPLEFHPNDTALSGRLLFGYHLRAQEPSGSWGSNLRIEFSTNFYFPDFSQTKTLEDPSAFGPAPIGIVGGAFFSNDGMEGLALLGLGGVLFPFNDTPDLRFNADYDYIDFTLSLRRDYPLVKDTVTLSPYAGITLAILDQTFSYSAETPSNTALVFGGFGGKFDYAVKEELDSWYAGLIIGADVIFNVTPQFSVSIGGAFLPLYADTDMDIKFDGEALQSLGPLSVGDLTTRVSDSSSNWTFRAMFNAEVAYRINWFEVSLSGMVDYWNDVPVVDYPDYNNRDWGVPIVPINNFTSDVPEIDGKQMLNYGVSLNVTFYFM
jgi:hypothetical protein